MSVYFSRKMKKNFAGVVVAVLLGLLVCFALANLVLMAEDQTSSDSSDINENARLYRSQHKSVKSHHLLSNGGGMNSKNMMLAMRNYRAKHYVPNYRVVHLDFKGAPPSIHYLKELFPLISKAGGNALLIEYEDMFPYWGPVKNASALNAYKPQDIAELLSAAKENDLEVIPLVQTFGHMEHVLKLAEFSSLREMPPYPQSICPSKEASFTVVKTMLDQVMQLHPESTYLHIGCDEVYQLGVCSQCRAKLRDSPQLQYPPRQLFVDHVKRVANYAKTTFKVQPIMWDDMLRSMGTKELEESGLGKHGLVEPMVWVYVEDIDHFVEGATWTAYSATFSNMWVASAFKGAFGERLFMPNMLRHYRNHLSWRDIMARESSSSSGHGRPSRFRGLALTGWSRYDHFAVLCELLPVAVPSLILNLATVSSNGSEVSKFRATEKLLKCDVEEKNNNNARLSPLTLEQDPHQFELRRCRFPGAKVFGAVGSLHHFKAEVEALDTSSRETQGWLTPYNIRHNYTSPWRLSETVSGHAYLVKSLREYANKTATALAAIFDRPTVEEWVEQNIRPLQEKTEKLLQVVDKLTARNTWPRRPIP